MRPLLARTGERVRSRLHADLKIWKQKRTGPDLMIIIYFPDIKKSRIIDARGNFFDDVFRSLICRHVVYKIAKDSNVISLFPTSSPLLMASCRDFSSLKQISYAVTISKMSRNLLGTSSGNESCSRLAWGWFKASLLKQTLWYWCSRPLQGRDHTDFKTKQLQATIFSFCKPYMHTLLRLWAPNLSNPDFILFHAGAAWRFPRDCALILTITTDSMTASWATEGSSRVWELTNARQLRLFHHHHTRFLSQRMKPSNAPLLSRGMWADSLATERCVAGSD